MFTKYNFAIGGLLPSDPDALPPFAAGVLIAPDRTAETDGHQIVIVTSPESQPTLFPNPEGMEDAENFTPFLMDRESALSIAKVMPKRDPDAPENSMAMLDVSTEAESDSTLAVIGDIRRQILKSIKRDASKFPNIDAVVPRIEDARFEIRFNADILVPVLRLFQKFAGDGASMSTITMRLYEAHAGVRIDADGPEQKMIAVVMPLRSVETVSEAPEGVAVGVEG